MNTSRIVTAVSVAGVMLLSACNSAEAQFRTDAEAYLKSNISTLSPRNAEVGGTFYVTGIEWADDDTAIVSYEDGHIALSGRTDIRRDEDGAIVATDIILDDEGNGGASISEAQSSSSVSSSDTVMSSSVSSSAMTSSAMSQSSSSDASRPRAGAGEFCGGIAGILCADGLTCRYDGTYPDAGGTCI